MKHKTLQELFDELQQNVTDLLAGRITPKESRARLKLLNAEIKKLQAMMRVYQTSLKVRGSR